jgi:hypothetical protein
LKIAKDQRQKVEITFKEEMAQVRKIIFPLQIRILECGMPVSRSSICTRIIGFQLIFQQ